MELIPLLVPLFGATVLIIWGWRGEIRKRREARVLPETLAAVSESFKRASDGLADLTKAMEAFGVSLKEIGKNV